MAKTKITTITLILTIILLACFGASSFMLGIKAKADNNFEQVQADPNTNVDNLIQDIIQRKSAEFGTAKSDILQHSKFLKFAATSSADWFAFTLARYGFAGDYNFYMGHIDQLVTQRVIETDQMKDMHPSDWQRIVLTVAASGADPTKIGLSKRNEFINLYERAYYNVSAKMLDERGVSAWIWTLITVGALNLPDKPEAELNRAVIIEKISQLSHADGGFGLSAKSDADVTCMALTALSFFKNDSQQYGGKTIYQIIENGLAYLQTQLSEQCTLSSYNLFNAPSTAWGLIALCSLGLVDDVRFVKGGKTLQDGLNSFYLDGGGFSHQAMGQYDSRATQQSLYALVAVSRYRGGKPNLFDLSNKDDLIVSNGLTENDRIEVANLINLPQNSGLFFNTARLIYLIMRADSYPKKETDLKLVNCTLAMIIKIELEVRSINESIEKLMPIKKLKISDKSKIDAVIRQIERLPEYDIVRLENYSGLMQAKKRVENLQISTFVTLCLVVALGAAFFAFIISKGRNKSKKQG